jgi:hypothetical protein
MTRISKGCLSILSSAFILGVVSILSAQPSAPPAADRPYLAKDVKEAMDFLGTWARVTSGQEYFKDAKFVGSKGCGGQGCHDRQIDEWGKTWHSKILRPPSQDTIIGDFNNAVIHFETSGRLQRGNRTAT